MDFTKERKPDRVPPHSNDAEQATLGAMLIDLGAISLVLDARLSDRDFYSPAHRKIFNAIICLFERSQAADITTVAEELEKKEELSDCGGRTYLSELASGVATAANAEYYANIIKDKAKLRQMIEASMNTLDECYSQREETPIILESAERRIFDVVRGEIESNGRSYAELHKEIKAHYEFQKINGGGLAGISTGFPKFDRLMNGLKEGTLYIIAGRPSMGKTCLGLNIINNICQADPGAATLLISLEMPAVDVGRRSACYLAGISYAEAERGQLSKADEEKFQKALESFSQMNVHIADPPSLNPLQLRAKVRRLIAFHPIKAVCVDYIQLMTAPGENQNLRVAEISRQLKAIAKEFSLPMIAISQLSRYVEQRSEKRPNLGDLRDSGAIEQDADSVIFVYRPEVYLRHLPQENPKRKQERGRAEIIIGKNRNGPTGVVDMRFDESSMRFEEGS